LKFKVTTLRNVQVAFPYMQDGRFRTLKDVVKHYNSLKANKILPTELAKPIHLTDNERTDLVAFLKTLTDKEFLFNARFSYPK